MIPSPNRAESALPTPAPSWDDCLHLSPVVASIRMSLATNRPVTVERARIELRHARRRWERRHLRAAETRDNFKADGLGRRLQGIESTLLYKLMVQSPLRPDRAELLAEAA